MSTYNVIKPFAYQTTTPPVHPTGTSGSVRTGGATSFLAGAAGFAGLASDIWQAVYAKRRAEEANKLSFKAAADSSARASAEARAARNWNSEQAQIRRMRMAGLSPGLAYGQMSPSTAVAASQDKADVHKADTPKFDNESFLHVLQLLINQQNADTQAAGQISTADLQSTQAQLNRIESQFKAQEKLAGISAVLAQKDLTDEEKLSVIAKRLPEVELLQSQANSQDAAARNANANAAVTEQTGIPLINSQIASNLSNARNLNANASVTESYGAKLAAAELSLKQESKELTKSQREKIKLDYYLTNDQYELISEWLANNGFDERYAPVLMLSLHNIASSSGMEVTSLVDDLLHLPSNMIKRSMDLVMSFLR